MAPGRDKDEALKRLGGGRWQTRDDRFTIEPQSGTWVVVDAEQTDDLGLPLVRGPFGSLRDAKDAIESARQGAPATSPLAARPKPAPSEPRAGAAATKAPARKPSPSNAGKPAPPPEPEPTPEPKPPPEPRWIADLEPSARRRARRLIGALTDAGAPDPEGIARRDIGGKVAATAAFAVRRAIAALGPQAAPADVAELLADGRDRDLDVRWRLVDGEGRPIVLDVDDLRRG
jgi:hypothetical protein